MTGRDDGGPRLLLVSYHFPSSSGVGALRWAGLIRYLLPMGWRVRVISAFPPPADRSLEAADVRHIPLDRTLDMRYKAWKSSPKSARFLRGVGLRRKAAEADAGSEPWRIPFGLGGVKRELGALLAFPDEARGWIRPAAMAVREEVKAFDPHVIVSSGPPHAAHLAVRLAGVRGAQGSTGASAARLKWFLDYRDPWASHQATTKLTGRLLRCVEGWSLKAASGVITTTPEFRNQFETEFPGVPAHWLSNGVDPVEAMEARRPRNSTFDVVHVGTLYIGRDPKPVVDGVLRFLGRRPEARSGFRLRFVGPVNPPHDEVLARAAEGGLAGVLEQPGRVPRDEALDILAGSSVAVVLAQDQALQVPAKLFESVGLGIPTLAVTEETSATAAAAQRIGAEVADPADPDSVARALERIWDSRIDRVSLPAAIRYDCLAHQAAALLVTGSLPQPQEPDERGRARARS